MSKPLTRSKLLFAWFSAVAFLVAGGLALGATIAAGTGMLVLALCIVPPAILLMMWPSAPTLSVAEVLRNVDRSS
jgi:hypothetical protein